ncbi:MAG: RecQ family ATP-dependent DNA helicase [Verrucomicrobia bacterium]|nr:RecQ family ATP-dependent DNA helicase [Verrucomicrobiota bacterium]
MLAAPAPATPREALERHFGFREFLDAQEEVIRAILSGEDVLCVMPTGGGKSLCYQLPALVLEGVTVVVSPLIALMKDQVDALARRGIDATLINSTLTFEEQKDRLRRLAGGEYKLVYIAPERFRSRMFLDALGRATISLFAVDEAHCISQWGHDFRPDYYRLSEALEKLGHPQVAAFTATATPEVRRDILQRLALDEPREFVSGFARPNLRLGVTEVSSETDKYQRLRALIQEHRTGIVYCATRKRVEAVSAELAQWGVRAIAYHGGMTDEERDAVQNRFIRREIEVAVATNAFGMGIDRPDIRFVAHFEIPGSLEAYYQEAGRAGRDGEPGVCELLFNYADTRVQEFFIEGSNPKPQFIREVYDELRSLADPQGEVVVTISDLSDRLSGAGKINDMAVSSALGILNRADFIDRYDIPGQRTRGTRITDLKRRGRDLPLDVPTLEEKERRDRAKLKAMLDWAYARDCRQRVILRYFGEPDPARCGTCDNCLAERHGPQRRGTDEEWTIVRKALSGVARMSERADGQWRGRFGRGKIVQCLLGSRSQEIVVAGLDQLSTHGILKDLGASYVNELFRELAEKGCVTSTSGQYPLLTLTPTGEAVMRGTVNPELQWPERQKPKAKASLERSRTGGGKAGARQQELAEAVAPEDTRLLSALREKRDELARAGGDLPRYLIFPDETLRALARLKPKSLEAGRKLRGVGEVKAARYLPAFIEVIREHEGRA